MQNLPRVQWSPLVLSLEVAIVATSLAAAIGTALGAALARRGVPARDGLEALVTAPLVLPPTVLGYYVLVAIGRESALGRAFEALTGGTIVFSKTGCVVAAFVGALPYVVRSSRVALAGVDPSLVRAARTLGASPSRAFFTIELPLARSGIAAGIALAFARSLGDFGVTLMVAGNIPGETRTASLAIYDAIQAGRSGEAAGMILVLSAIAIAALYLVNKLVGGARAV